MPTPFEKIQNSFHSKFQSKTILNPELEKQFFFEAIGVFSLELYDLDYIEISEEIKQDLKQHHINLLGHLMYKSYLGRERDRMLKLNNIIGKDVQMTGLSDSKREIKIKCILFLMRI